MFKIDSTELIDYTLRLQKINDVALPMTTQNMLNNVAKDVKIRTLKKSVDQQFNVKRPNFFKSNSAYKPYRANQFGYNINKMKSEVGMTEGKDSKETATEQVGKQERPGGIKRGINPIGDKPQPKGVIDILKKKPEIVDWSDSNREKSINSYMRGASRAKRRGAGLVIRSGSGGSMYRVRTFKKRKPTKKNPNRFTIELKQIASYRKGGTVKITKQRPFLTNAVNMSMKEKMNSEFIKAAERQFARALKR